MFGKGNNKLKKKTTLSPRKVEFPAHKFLGPPCLFFVVSLSTPPPCFCIEEILAFLFSNFFLFRPLPAIF
jgi:hypothetical protein